VLAPASKNDLRFAKRREDLTVEQFGIMEQTRQGAATR
jgi:hypothetical protein